MHFFLQPHVTVYISGSVTIHLLGINTESMGNSPMGGLEAHTRKKKIHKIQIGIWCQYQIERKGGKGGKGDRALGAPSYQL